VTRTLLLALLFAACVCAEQLTVAQKPVTTQTPQTTDVLRINTELVQTDVTVLDKQGRFVDGLRADQFELTLDGKAQPISFFERINTGTAKELKQLAASRGGSTAANPLPSEAEAPGRVILFFLDDLHLSAASLTRARQALSGFVETRLRDTDQVAIVSTSGQIGFLQQLTDEPAVMREAIARLNNKHKSETYAGRTAISDFQANQIANHNDRDLFNYLVSSTMNEYQLVPPKGGDPRGLAQLATNNVRNRVRQIEVQTRINSVDTLGVLLSLMRSTTRLPGRKLLFFVSDGFVVDARSSDALTLLKQVTLMAARQGIVVYTMEARGTYYTAEIDATSNAFVDGLASGTSARMPTIETQALREPLRILADDTGGRALLNSNSIPDSIQEAIDETAAYYLLAWRPETENERGEKARLKVTVRDRPDLRVRLRKNYYVPSVPSDKSQTKASSDSPNTAAPPGESKPDAEMLATLGALYPDRELPAALSVGYLNESDKNATLKLSMQVVRRALMPDSTEAKAAEVDVIGAAIDDRGVIVTFKQVVSVVPDQAAQQAVIWHQQLSVPPGLYQVRVALRERATGRTGSARQWIRVPQRRPSGLNISSLFLGERKPAIDDPLSAPNAVKVSVDHRFARTSVLRFQTYVSGELSDTATAPDVEIQATVLRGGKPVLTMPAAKLPIETARATSSPYWAEVPLAKLSPGHYRLQVVATNRKTGTSVTEAARFIVE